MIQRKSHFSPFDFIIFQMDDFKKVFKKDAQVGIKIEDNLDKYIKLSYTYQSKIGYDTLVQKVIHEENINLMGTTIVDT